MVDTPNEALSGPSDDQNPLPSVNTPEAETDTAETNTETFPRSYVEELRRENASWRDKARTAETRADELSRALFTAKVEATGKVENPAEIPYSGDILDDADALNQAIDAAISERPYIKRRNITGDAGQGVKSNTNAPQDFSALFR